MVVLLTGDVGEVADSHAFGSPVRDKDVEHLADVASPVARAARCARGRAAGIVFRAFGACVEEYVADGPSALRQMRMTRRRADRR